MSNRERTLAILLLGLIIFAVGGVAGYMLIYEPIQAKTAAANKLAQEITDLEAKKRKADSDRLRLAIAKKRSLPADENLARQEYNVMLAQLLRQAGIPPGYSIISKPVTDARTIPVLPGGNKKPAYTKIVTEVDFKKADMWAVHDFLLGYYRLNLLQQITSIEIKKDDDQPGAGGRARVTPDRKDLSVKLITEALIIDGAEHRRTLLPVPTAFAAVGGWSGYDTIALYPEIGRGLNPLQLAPVLATGGPKPRDYTLIVEKDPFHGPYPAPENLSLPKISELAVPLGEPIPTIPIAVRGEPAFLGKVTLTAKSDNPRLLPATSLKLDQSKRTITATPTKDQIGSANITIFAKAQNGQESKTEFKLRIEDKSEGPAPPPTIDISPAIVLTGVTPRSDGTTFAVIRDFATPYKYEVEATPKGVTVVKYYFLNNMKRKVLEYETPDLLVLSDGNQNTEQPAVTLRSFRIVAVDDTGLIVQDLRPAAKPAPKPIGRPGFGGKGPPAPSKAAPVNAPLAAVVGLAGSTANPPLSLFHWKTGKSLEDIKPIPQDEALRILHRASLSGPINAAELAGNDIVAPRAAKGN